MPKFIYAASSVIFLTILLVSLIVLGDHRVKTLAFMALFSAALSQFVAQDAARHVNIYLASIILAWLAVIFSFAAIVFYA